MVAAAQAGALGVGQVLFGATTVTANVINSGTIAAHAVATAHGTVAAASANAVGVSVNALTLGTLNMHIVNDGLIEANAFASASGFARAQATGIFVQSFGTKTGSIVNGGSIFATAVATGSPGVAGAIGIFDPSQQNTAQIVNTGLIHAYAQASNVENATGILIRGPQCRDGMDLQRICEAVPVEGLELAAADPLNGRAVCNHHQ